MTPARLTDDWSRIDSPAEPQVVRGEPGARSAESEIVIEPKPLQPSQPTPLQAQPRDENEPAKASIDEAAPPEARLANLEQEQAILLHKADLFMDHVLERRKAADVPRELEELEEAPEAIDPGRVKLQPQLNASLQPTPPPPRKTEDSERPSLVIGKLTVEVIPPSPAPVQTQMQGVVLRGARSRGVRVLSGRRFGLSQF